MKKFLSALLSLTMIATSFGSLGVMAEENEATAPYADCLQVEKPENIIPDASYGGGQYYLGRNNGSVTVENVEDAGVTLASKWANTGEGPLALHWSVRTPFDGIQYNNNDEQFPFDPEPGTNYVFKANVKNASTEGITPYIGVSMVDASWNQYTLDTYGTTGMAVGDDWQEFSGIISIPESANYVDKNPVYTDIIYVGFPAETPAGAAFYLDVSDADSVYFAKEGACTIDSAISGSNEVTPDQTIEASATVENQLGDLGNLSQSFTWKVVNTDRTEEVSGFTFETNENTVTVSVDETVEPGNYVLLAQSDDNQQLQKGLDIVVGAAKIYEDCVEVEKPQNIIPDASYGEGQGYLGRNNGPIDVETARDAGVRVASKWYYGGTDPLTIAWDARNYFDGIEYNQGDSQFEFDPEAGTNYVFKASVKNASTEGITPYVGVSMVDASFDKYTLDTYGTTGMAVGNDWQEFSGVISIPESANYADRNPVYTDAIYVGFPAGTEAGAAFYLDVSDPDSVYFAKEAPCTIESEINGSNVVTSEQSIKATALVKNQLGTVGSLSQDFAWKVVNPDRTEEVSGFTFETEENTVTVSVDSTVPAGDYVLLAQSSENTKLQKGIEISVKAESLYKDYNFTGEMPENIIPDASYGEGQYYLGRNNGSIDVVTARDAGVSVASKWYYGGTDPLVLHWSVRTPFDGIQYNNNDEQFPFDPEPGTNYVFKANVKNASTEGITPYIGVSMVDASWNQYTLDTYGTTGMAVGDDWQEFSGIISIPESANYVDKNPVYTDIIYVGFPAETPAGAAFYLDVSDPDSVYFAKEDVIDMGVQITEGEIVAHGEVIKAEAATVNQLGRVGGLSQDFTWYVVDENREDLVSGFEIVSEGGVAEVTVGDEVPAGNYVLIAEAPQNQAYKMGVEFEVVEKISYEDYEAGEKPQNIIPDASSGSGVAYLGRNNGEIDYDVIYNSDVVVKHKWTYKNAEGTPLKIAYDVRNYFDGMEYNTQDSQFEFDPKAGTNYVFKASVKNASTEGITPYVGVSMVDASWNKYTLDTYGTTGMAVGNDWQEFSGVISIPESANYADRNPVYTDAIYVGFPAGTEAGSAFYLDVSDPDSVYFAEEVAYDIIVENTGADTINVGKKITAEAEIINQIGGQGTLAQDINWYVVDADRTDKVSGFSVATNGNSVTVTAGLSVQPGKYVLIAENANKAVMKKGIEFEVVPEDTWINYVPDEMNENIIPDASYGEGQHYLGRNNGPIDVVTARDAGVSVASKWFYSGTDPLTLAWAARNYFDGIEYNTQDSQFEFDPKAGTNYVFKASVKNASPEGITPYVGVSMVDANFDKYTLDTYGTTGMAVSADWQDLKGVISIPESANYADRNPVYTDVLYVGFPEGTAAGSAFYLDVSEKDSVYFAEEQLYNIVVEADKPTTMLVEDASVITFNAKVVNQIGLKSNFKQNFKWAVLDRTGKVIEDAPLTVSGDTLTATLDLPNMEAGSYTVAVKSLDYEEFQRLTTVDMLNEVSNLYVAPNGSDLNAGTEAEPLATLAGAVAKVRNIKALYPDTAINVIFAAGEYAINDTVEFTAEDAYSYASKVTYKAADGAQVIFKGSEVLDLAGAKAVTDQAILNRLPENAKDKVVVIDLSGVDLTHFAGLEPTATNIYGEGGNDHEHFSLVLNGEEQMLAQWPNGNANYSKWSYVDDDTFGYLSTATNVDKWQVNGAWIGGYMNTDYQYMRLPLVSVDSSNKHLNVEIDKVNSLYVNDSVVSAGISYRWKAFNILEELDAPTEWYVDTENQKLYYYPPENASDTLELSTLKNEMINLTDSKNIAFEGITFMNTRGNAIVAEDVDGIEIKGCTFKNISGTAFENVGTEIATTDKDYWQWQYKNASYNCIIEDSIFEDIGGRAILIDGGDIDTLTPSNNVIRNNIIYNVSTKIRNADAITVKGCGNQILNNNISRTPFIAIHTYGNDHVISYNEIYNVIQDSDDSGAIYMGRNTVQRGTVISYNYIHDLDATFDAVFGHRVAIYWDDMQTGATAYKNIIANVPIDVYTNGVDNVFTNNITYNAQKRLMFSDGGAAANHNDYGTYFRGTIADKDLYYAKYTNLKAIVEANPINNTDSSNGGRELAKYNEIKNNVAVDSGATAIGSFTSKPVKGVFGIWKASDNVANNNTTSTSDFVAPSKQDYRLKSTSSYASSGVLTDSFDIEKIGITTDNSIASANVKLAGVQENGKDAVLMWYESLGATYYRVTVAEDEGFDTVVFEGDADYNYITVSGLDTVNKTYYWKVTAYNSSREFTSSWTSEVGTFGYEEVVDPFVVETSIDGNVAKVTITNNLYEDGVIVYIAEYEGTTLKSAHKEVITDLGVAKDATKTVVDGTTVKAFIWNAGQEALTDVYPIR